MVKNWQSKLKKKKEKPNGFSISVEFLANCFFFVCLFWPQTFSVHKQAVF